MDDVQMKNAESTDNVEPPKSEASADESAKDKNTQTKDHSLFGGAFSIKKFPSTFRDISDIVPVSDNQEIFSDLNEGNPQYSGN